jgi:hypothetical protein
MVNAGIDIGNKVQLPGSTLPMPGNTITTSVQPVSPTELRRTLNNQVGKGIVISSRTYGGN